MPAKSKAQQRFMGMVHGLQKGTVKPSKVSDKVKKVAKDMEKKDAEDFASTKHKGLPKKVKEALLSENPAVSAAAAMAVIQMQNPDTGKKIKAITPLKNKDHKLHGKAKGIFKRLKDKFSKKKPRGTVHNYLRGEEVEEGFGGDLKGSDKTKFEKARKENAEVLGYKLTGTKDIKESIKKALHEDMDDAELAGRIKHWSKQHKGTGIGYGHVLGALAIHMKEMGWDKSFKEVVRAAKELSKKKKVESVFAVKGKEDEEKS